MELLSNFYRIAAMAAAAALAPLAFSAPVALGAEEDGAPLFENITAEKSGIDFSVPIDTQHADDRLYYSAMACGGVAAGDLDGDGRIDLFFACGAVPNRLYRQTSEDFVFEDVTAQAGVAAKQVWATGAALADIDNDGDLDIYLTCYDDPNRLFINDSEPGKMVFHEKAADFGLDVIDACLGASFIDYDRDGDLDLFLPMNAYYRDGGRPAEGIPMKQTARGLEVVAPWDRFYGFSSFDPESGEAKYTEVGRPNRLLRNDGGRFVDVSAAAGISVLPSHSNAAAWWDYDGDGWLDLHVGNDFADRDQFYRNQGDGTFAEVAAMTFQHTTWFSMGSAAEDLNNDGRVDFVAADMLPSTHYREKVTMGDMDGAFTQMFEKGLPRQKMVNTLFVNTGTGLFLETAFASGLARTDWTWTVKSADFDGDGRIDLYFPTGHTRDFIHSDLAVLTPADKVGKNEWDQFEDAPELRERDAVFRNLPTDEALRLDFEHSEEAWGLGLEKTMSYGGAVADIDGDGDSDLVVMNLEDAPSLYRNTSADRELAHFLGVRLFGKRSNRFGIGAVVRAELPDGRRLIRTLTPQNGYLGSDEPQVRFGLGAYSEVAVLSIEWPSGVRQRLERVASGQVVEVEELDEQPEGESPPNSDQAKKPTQPWFGPTGSLAGVTVRENAFDDFAQQPLLPNKLSQLGPGQAWGDVDGDGFADLYLGSPSGALGRMLLSRGVDEEGRPKFAMRLQAPFDDPAYIEREDMGAVFFDADRDGDEDLFVVSGGVEWQVGDGRYQDRLYLNDGLAGFVEAPLGSLPESTSSGGPVAAADFDRDGDIDLFVGGRVVPGSYPTAARSQVLRNDGSGQFVDITNRLSTGLARSGMVTSALWSDIDDDGWLDLMLTHEWGTVRVYRNQEGKALQDVTPASGLADLSGFWNSIAGRDFDGDGDLDYLVGNLGWNTKYKASPEKPEILFYGDLDGTGKKHLVEAKLDAADGTLLPRRGLSCSSRAMPALAEKFTTYEAFARDSLPEIYAQDRLATATRFEANNLASVALVNDGSGKFEVVELPWLAQLAPVFGIAITELDGDGHPDAVLAQNFYSPQQENGPMDGGLSLLLKGTGNVEDRWRPVPPDESGVVISGDAKSVGFGDLNNDGRPDLVFGVNDAAPRLLLNRTGENESGARILKLHMRGPNGNKTAIGARVTVTVDGLPKQTSEQQAGSGYLTQNSAEMFFGLGAGPPADLRVTVHVRWPDGREGDHTVPEASLIGGSFVILAPD